MPESGNERRDPAPSYGHTEPAVTETEQVCHSAFLTVRLPASTRIRLTLRLRLRANTPSYRTPFDTPADRPSPGTEGETA